MRQLLSLIRRHGIFLLVVALFAAWSLKAIFAPGMMQTHDGLWQVQRASLMYESLVEGQFPVRWVEAPDNGYGIPLFNFVYPGPYYLAAPFMALGIVNITAIKLVTVLAYLAGGLGMYYLFRKNRVIALLTAIIYLLNPYQFVNLFVRGALGETIVIGLAPWLISTVTELVSRRLRWYEPLLLALALISHNFLGLLLAALLLAYGIFLRTPKRVLGYLLISLGLAAFFLIPMIAERGSLMSESTGNFSYIWSDHFIYPRQLLYSRWDYWYSMPGDLQDGMSFQLGFASIAALTVYLIWYIVRLRKLAGSERLMHGFWLLAAAALILTMIPAGRFFWETFPILQTMQFPWRLLGLMTIVTGVITGSLLSLRVKKHRLSGIALAVLLLALALVNTRNYHRPIKTLDAEEFRVLNAVFADKTTTSSRSEVVPRWAPVERYQPTSLRLFNPRLGIYDGNAELRAADMQPLRITFTGSAENERATAIYYHNYYPSWRVTVDGLPHTITPSDNGDMLIPLLQGEHVYELSLGTTTAGLIGNTLSLLSACVILLMFILRKRQIP